MICVRTNYIITVFLCKQYSHECGKNAVEQLGPNGIGGGICDDGMCDLNQSKGNVYLRPGGYLCCEKCTVNFLNASYTDWDKALSNIDSYFGPGVPQSVHQAVNICR